MQWGLTRLALQAARRTWRPKRLHNRVQNSKNQCWKTTHFWHRFFHDFASFLEGSEPWKLSSRLDGSTIFEKSTFPTNVRKNIDFECILGGQKPWFSHFLKCFWKANFKYHFKSQNMRVLNDENHRITPSWARLAECAAAGERKREGSEASWARFFWQKLLTRTWGSRICRTWL